MKKWSISEMLVIKNVSILCRMVMTDYVQTALKHFYNFFRFFKLWAREKKDKNENWERKINGFPNILFWHIAISCLTILTKRKYAKTKFFAQRPKKYSWKNVLQYIFKSNNFVQRIKSWYRQELCLWFGVVHKWRHAI